MLLAGFVFWALSASCMALGFVLANLGFDVAGVELMIVIAAFFLAGVIFIAADRLRDAVLLAVPAEEFHQGSK